MITMIFFVIVIIQKKNFLNDYIKMSNKNKQQFNNNINNTLNNNNNINNSINNIQEKLLFKKIFSKISNINKNNIVNLH